MFDQYAAEPIAVGCPVCGGFTFVPRQTRVVNQNIDGLVITSTLYANFLKFILPNHNVGLLCEPCGEKVLSNYELR